MNWMREKSAWIASDSRFDQQCLGQAGHAFQQDVAVGQQADQNALDQRFLADHDLVDFGQQVLHKDGFMLHLGIQFANTHWVHTVVISLMGVKRSSQGRL